MSVADRKLLKELCLTQAQLSRILKVSRQAVCSGIQNDGDYLNVGTLRIVHRYFILSGDPRQVLVGEILVRFGITPDSPVGISDVLGLELSEDRTRLILRNQTLRDHLKAAVSGVVETKCREFESLFIHGKRPE